MDQPAYLVNRNRTSLNQQDFWRVTRRSHLTMEVVASYYFILGNIDVFGSIISTCFNQVDDHLTKILVIASRIDAMAELDTIVKLQNSEAVGQGFSGRRASSAAQQ